MCSPAGRTFPRGRSTGQDPRHRFPDLRLAHCGSRPEHDACGGQRGRFISASRARERCSVLTSRCQNTIERRPACGPPGRLAARKSPISGLAHKDEEEALHGGQPSGAPDRRLVLMLVHVEKSRGAAPEGRSTHAAARSHAGSLANMARIFRCLRSLGVRAVISGMLMRPNIPRSKPSCCDPRGNNPSQSAAASPPPSSPSRNGPGSPSRSRVPSPGTQHGTSATEHAAAVRPTDPPWASRHPTGRISSLPRIPVQVRELPGPGPFTTSLQTTLHTFAWGGRFLKSSSPNPDSPATRDGRTVLRCA